MDAGLTLAGENRLQEALPKIEALKDTGVIWHFIGRLQRRKVRSVVGIFDLIHLSTAWNWLMRSIGGRGRQDYAKDPAGSEYRRRTQQAWFCDEAVGSSSLGALDHVAVRGLMAIPPLMREPERARRYFRALRDLAARLIQQKISRISMDELSMGCPMIMRLP